MEPLEPIGADSPARETRGGARAHGHAYDALYRASPFEDRPALYRWVTTLARPAPGQRLLDIACGLGGALVAAEATGAASFGLDLSREALGRARGRVRTARLCQADGSELPFADASFDVVLNLGNLEHFANLTAGLTEMRRVLVPAGRAWVLLPNLFYSGSIWRAIRGGGGPDHHQPIDRFATHSEWRDLLDVHGLQVVRSWPYHKGKWWKRMLPRNLAWHFLYETRVGPRRHDIEALAPLGRVRYTMPGTQDSASQP